jgi:predicted nucleic acid-binding protein
VIVVDTNVISELMRGEPHPAVLAWVAAQPRNRLYTTYVNQAEILYGIGTLPEGRRRAALAAAAEAMFAEDFAGRIPSLRGRGRGALSRVRARATPGRHSDRKIRRADRGDRAGGRREYRYA